MGNNNAEKGKKGKNASPWSKGPNCQTPSARLAYARYKRKEKALKKESTDA